MRLTNSLGLPDIFVRAIQNDTYDGVAASDYSTTSLIKPPRILALERKHRGAMVEDAADRVWSLFGQVAHAIIERAASDELVEKRLFMTISGKTISGQIDLFQGDTLHDWKTTSIYSGKDGAKSAWVEQGNINRLLCHENGIEVKRIQYVALYRDWSIMASHRKADYPEKAVEIFELPVWPLAQAREFVEARVAMHEAAKVELPLCTAEDRWQRDEKWALMKKGVKRARKLYDTEQEAVDAIPDPKTHKVEFRTGESVRCAYFCAALPFCQQGRELLTSKI